MTEDEKIEVALFRYSIISDLVNAKHRAELYYQLDQRL